jgi:hypothetical protein
MTQNKESQTNPDEYYGWINYETWLVSLWLNNNEGDYNYLNEIVSNESYTPEEKIDQIKSWVYEIIDYQTDLSPIPIGCMLQDLIPSDMNTDIENKKIVYCAAIKTLKKVSFAEIYGSASLE